MALRIRLARRGSKKRPFYHIVVADSRSPRDGRFVEKVGSYNPMLPKDSKDRVQINQERAQHWLKTGATPSDRVLKFLANMGLAEKPSVPEQSKQHLPKAKAQERIKEAEEAKKAAAEAEKAAKEQPKEEAEVETQTPAPVAEEAKEESAPVEETTSEEKKKEEAPASPTQEASEEKTEEVKE